MDWSVRDRAVVVGDAVIVADLHLGKADGADLELPVGDTSDVLERLDGLLGEVGPDRLVVAGDMLHSFSTVTRPVRRAVDAIDDLGADHDVDVVVTPGNHDAQLDGVWDGPTSDAVRVGDDVVVCHGHEPPAKTGSAYVVGHDHPTISIEGDRRPCFLHGECVYEGADVLVVPSFNRLVRGVPAGRMAADEFRSPLVGDADRFRPLVRDPDADETLSFPPLGEFRELL